METFSQDDFVTFAKKLEDWSKTLSNKERAILQQVLDRANGGGALSDDELDSVSGGAGTTVPTLPTGTKAPQLQTPIGASTLKVGKLLPGMTPTIPTGIVAPDM